MNRENSKAKTLLTRAALYRLLARAFAYPSPGHVAEVREAFAALSSELERGQGPLGRYLPRARRAWRQAEEEILSAGYLRLFATGGPVRLHETAYGDARRFAGREVELADLNGFYAAFGFGLSQTDPDLPDHFSVELEFLALLLVKEAWARMRGWRRESHVTADAVSRFLEQHLGRWLEPLGFALDDAGAGSPWRELADLASAAVEDECRQRRVRPQPFAGVFAPDVMQAESFTCPQAEAAPGH